jgi:hypothetical protein
LFKDLKGSFALEACQLETLNRITRACLFVSLALWTLALLVRYCARWARFITARGALSFVSLALEWLDSPPSQRRILRAQAKSDVMRRLASPGLAHYAAGGENARVWTNQPEGGRADVTCRGGFAQAPGTGGGGGRRWHGAQQLRSGL